MDLKKIDEEEQAPSDRLKKGRFVSALTGRGLVRRREVDLKKVRSRFTNPGARKQWGGYAGIGRLTYRWSNARNLLADLLVARGDA